MMEEWHQKLHNNTSPDDVIICQVSEMWIWIYFFSRFLLLKFFIRKRFLQALIDYIKSDFDISAYWKTLNDNGITKERLLSYDRAIHSEPNFRRDQKDGLLRDLGNYMRTLKVGFLNLSREFHNLVIFYVKSCLTWKLQLVNFQSSLRSCCAMHGMLNTHMVMHYFLIKDEGCNAWIDFLVYWWWLRNVWKNIE